MATAIPFEQVFQTVAGAPVSGVKVYTYAPGTTTPRTAYSDTGLTVPVANPFIGNSAGYAAFYLSSDLGYRIVAKSADDSITYYDGEAPSVVEGAQPVDATLTSLAGLTTAEGDFIEATASDVVRVRKLQRQTYAALTAIAAASRFDDMLVYVASRATDGDGGEGWWRFDASSSATANGGTILAPDAGTGRWLRQYSDTIKIQWFGPVNNGSADASAIIQPVINLAQELGLFLDLQEEATYRIDTGLTFKHGMNSTDTVRYRVKMRGNNATLTPAASVTAISIVPRCLLADAGTGRGIAEVFISDLKLDGAAAPTTAKGIVIGAAGLVCDNFGYSIVTNVLCLNFDNNSTVSLVECRHFQFNHLVIRGSTLRIAAATTGSFCGDLNFQTCEFSSSATNDNLVINAGNGSTNAQVRGLHFESCVFYGQKTDIVSNGAASQVGDVWFNACQWDVGTEALSFTASNTGQMFQIHMMSCYIVNYSTRAITITRSGSSTIRQFTVLGGGISEIAGTDAILVLASQNIKISDVQFDNCTSSSTLINIDACENVFLSGNVATRCTGVGYFMAIGNGSDNYSIVNNMANVGTGMVNDYTAGAPTRQTANNLLT